MLGKNWIRKSVTAFTAVAFWCVSSMAVLAAPTDVKGEISLTGQVTINGQNAISNSTVVSGSSIAAGANSSAIVSLGKNGRIEIFSDSTVNLTFNENSIVASLTTGKIRISNNAGIGTTVTTRNATVIADTGQSNVFTVDVGCGNEDRCALTNVDTTTGLVTLRSGSVDRQVAAGTDASAGDLAQTGCPPCLRPNSAPPVPTLGLGALPIAAILIAAAGAAGAAILLNNKNETTTGGGTIIVSPTR